MKHTLLFILPFLLVVSCQDNSHPRENMGSIEKMDLSSLKSLLSQKKTEIKSLESDIHLIVQRMEQIDPSLKERKEEQVTVLPVYDTVFNRFVTVQGLLEADETVSVNAETSGRIMSLKIKEGDYIKKGDLVAILDVEQVDMQRAELEKGYELAVDVYERQKRLWDQNIGSEIQYLQAKNEKERLEKSLETLEFQKSKGRVFAPVSGVVDIINIREGEIASPGAPIAVILDIRQLIATADVPENYLGSVGLGDNVEVRIPSLDIETKGRITLVGSKIDMANRTFRVEARIPRVSKNLKPNLLTEIRFNEKSEDDVLMIPINLIQQEISGADYLMIVDRSEGDPVAKKVYILRGESNDKNVIIKDGLSDGDEVIYIGARTVSDGSAIKILENSVLAAKKNNNGQ